MAKRQKPLCKQLGKPIGDIDVKECNIRCGPEQKTKCLDAWIEYERSAKRKEIKIKITNATIGETVTLRLDAEKVEAELHEFLDYIKRLVEQGSGREIEITGGGYRGYDIQLQLTDETGKTLPKPRVDVYTPMRIHGWDSPRVRNAIDWAIRCIKANKILPE